MRAPARPAPPVVRRPLHDLDLPRPVRRVPDDHDATRPVVGKVDEIDVLRDLHPVRRRVVRSDRQLEADRYVARFAPDGLEVLDHCECRTGWDGRLPGASRDTGQVEEQTVDRGQDQSADEQRHALDDGADDESGQRRSAHRAGQEPPCEGDRLRVSGARALGDRHAVILPRGGGNRKTPKRLFTAPCPTCSRGVSPLLGKREVAAGRRGRSGNADGEGVDPGPPSTAPANSEPQCRTSPRYGRCSPPHRWSRSDVGAVRTRNGARGRSSNPEPIPRPTGDGRGLHGLRRRIGPRHVRTGQPRPDPRRPGGPSTGPPSSSWPIRPTTRSPGSLHRGSCPRTHSGLGLTCGRPATTTVGTVSSPSLAALTAAAPAGSRQMSTQCSRRASRPNRNRRRMQ
ncbi:hypothetical protein RKD18_007463 [Streptomyces phaeoluteigriseus]